MRSVTACIYRRRDTGSQIPYPLDGAIVAGSLLEPACSRTMDFQPGFQDQICVSAVEQALSTTRNQLVVPIEFIPLLCPQIYLSRLSVLQLAGITFRLLVTSSPHAAYNNTPKYYKKKTRQQKIKQTMSRKLTLVGYLFYVSTCGFWDQQNHPFLFHMEINPVKLILVKFCWPLGNICL